MQPFFGRLASVYRRADPSPCCPVFQYEVRVYRSTSNESRKEISVIVFIKSRLWEAVSSTLGAGLGVRACVCARGEFICTNWLACTLAVVTPETGIRIKYCIDCFVPCICVRGVQPGGLKGSCQFRLTILYLTHIETQIHTGLYSGMNIYMLQVLPSSCRLQPHSSFMAVFCKQLVTTVLYALQYSFTHHWHWPLLPFAYVFHCMGQSYLPVIDLLVIVFPPSTEPMIKTQYCTCSRLSSQSNGPTYS